MSRFDFDVLLDQLMSAKVASIKEALYVHATEEPAGIMSFMVEELAEDT